MFGWVSLIRVVPVILLILFNERKISQEQNRKFNEAIFSVTLTLEVYEQSALQLYLKTCGVCLCEFLLRLIPTVHLSCSMILLVLTVRGFDLSVCLGMDEK